MVGVATLITTRFKNSFKEEGTLEVCLGREVGIGQVEKGDRRQSLKDERRLGRTRLFQGVTTWGRTLEWWRG